jgi:hypothetical protein
MSTDYKLQYDKVLRLLVRVKEQYGSLPGQVRISASSTEEERQNILGNFQDLFVNLHSLKDWTKNDSSLPEHVRDGVENYIEHSHNLKLLADAANVSKHSKLTKSKWVRISADTRVRTNLILNGPIGSFPIGGFYGYCVNVVTGISEYDVEALSLAEKCLQEWNYFFDSNNLAR